MSKHIKKIKILAEGIYTNDFSTTRAALLTLLQTKDEDILVITIREFVNSGILIPGRENKITVAVSGIILDNELRRSLLTKLARRLNDPISTKEYVQWADDILAKNVHMGTEEFADQWSNLNDVINIRKIIRQVPYSSAIEERCEPIRDDRDYASRRDNQARRTRRDAAISGGLPDTGNCYDENGHFIYSDPMPNNCRPIIPEEVEDP